MKRYKVTIAEMNYFDVIVEVDNADEAFEAAQKKLNYEINIISDDTEQNLQIFDYDASFLPEWAEIKRLYNK